MADESYAFDDCPNVVSAPASSSNGLGGVEACSDSRSGELLTTLIPRPLSLDTDLDAPDVYVLSVIVCGQESYLNMAVSRT
jgi:hypothetical protein